MSLSSNSNGGSFSLRVPGYAGRAVCASVVSFFEGGVCGFLGSLLVFPSALGSSWAEKIGHADAIDTISEIKSVPSAIGLDRPDFDIDDMIVPRLRSTRMFARPSSYFSSKRAGWASRFLKRGV